MINNILGLSQKPQKRTRKHKFAKMIEPWLYLIPLILVIVLAVYPLGNAIWLSLTDKRVGFAANFVGLANYLSLAKDPVFIQTAKNTLIFTVAAIVFKFILGMIMALVLNENFPLRNITRGILALPWIIPTVVGVLIWYWMFNETNGLLNIILGKHFPWLSDKYYALFSVIFVNIWRGFPFFGINLLAGLQSISPELYEAAKVDGANALGRFWFITVPGLKYVIFVTTALSTIWTINDFQVVKLLTGGGPGTATQIFATLTYEIGISSLQLGRGIAVSLFVLPVLVIGMVFLVKRMNRD